MLFIVILSAGCFLGVSAIYVALNKEKEEGMKRKRLFVLPVVLMAMSIAFPSFAAGWQQSGDTWSFTNPDGKKLTGSWLQDTDGRWYYLDTTGTMVTGWTTSDGELYYLSSQTGGPKGSLCFGWQKLDGTWYFFNTLHDGTFGKAFTGGWQWIDGYCYYFGQKEEKGRMYADGITPDGYTVGSTGAWMENGSYVYQPGKGILTKSVAQNTSSSTSAKSGNSGQNGSGSEENGNPSTNTMCTYRVTCIDIDTQKVLAVYEGSDEIGNRITPDYEIEGYTILEDYEFKLSADKEDFDIYYVKNQKQYTYTIYRMDIDSGEELGTVLLTGIAGEEIELGDIELDGYSLLGNPPGAVTVNKAEANNYIYLYYKKESNYEPDAKEVTYSVEFVDASDHTNRIQSDVTGTGKVGETIPVYFTETINDREGNIWGAVGYSPRMFILDDKSVQVFTIEYLNTGEIPSDEETLYAYSVSYIAGDTNATLGITTGYAAAGTKISYRNSFADYGFIDDVKAFIVADEESENMVTVYLNRTMFPGPDKNGITGEYDGCKWLVLFTDNEGTLLLPKVRGFSLNGDNLVIDYPDLIEGTDGSIYRAKTAAPYNKVQSGTTYRQIVIEYVKGDISEDKLLLLWQKEAQAAKNAFYKTTPYSYAVVYREKNSWNDIALRLGVSTENSYVSIPAMEIDDYLTPTESLGGFELTEDGITGQVSYQRAQNGTSLGYAKTEYTISFEDEDGNPLFDSYTGYMAALGLESVMSLPVYYPNSYTDSEGNRWEADIKSPQTFAIDTLSLNGNANCIIYKKVFENPMTDMITDNQVEALAILETFAALTDDAAVHSFYLIGNGYSPKDMAAGSVISTYGLFNYSNAIADVFEIDGTVYTVCQVSFERKWNPDDCSHVWKVTSQTDGGCLINSSETITCQKCGTGHTTILPALGHVDGDDDSVCDNCGKRAFDQILGDDLIATFASGSSGLTMEYKFICIDDDYQGSGKMLYLCETDLMPEVYGVYSGNGQADFESSDLNYFLNDEFLDGLGLLGDETGSMGQNRVAILSKDEYDRYKDNAENKYAFPDGVFITQTLSDDAERIVLTNGEEISVVDADQYPVRPVILLDKPETTDTPQAAAWKLGDLQARTIGGKVYLFRCVNVNYKDKTGTAKQMALFLCESVIPADIVNNGITEGIETLFFGDSNNYKYSAVNQWLGENASDSLFQLSSVNIGVDSSYSGSTQKYGYSQLSSNLLTKYTFDTTQYMKEKLFSLSVEEALELKEYLWKFGSDGENPQTQINGYCNSYWLRTPEYGTTDRVYTVNLHDGTIESRSVKAESGSSYSNTGIRPAFVMPQMEQ